LVYRASIDPELLKQEPILQHSQTVKRLCKRAIEESRQNKPHDRFVADLAKQFSCTPSRAVANALELIESFVVAETRVLARSGQVPSIDVLKTKYVRKFVAYSWLYSLVVPIT
jgi:uncharacterized MAPEG superfamily protein